MKIRLPDHMETTLWKVLVSFGDVTQGAELSIDPDLGKEVFAEYTKTCQSSVVKKKKTMAKSDSGCQMLDGGQNKKR